MKSKRNHPIILVYGFDKIGYKIEDVTIIENSEFDVEFIPFGNNIKVEKYEGLIFPQGIFEKLEKRSGFATDYIDVKCFQHLLLGIERQVLNHIKKNKWICFLVDKIIDRDNSSDFNDTDLCKRMLNLLGVNRISSNGTSTILSKNNEFDEYIQKYGVAKTFYQISSSEKKRFSVLANFGYQIVGFDFGANFFFLPFHTLQLGNEDLIYLSNLLYRSITNYRQKKIIELPEWLNGFRFIAEESLLDETNKLLHQIEKKQIELSHYKGYKSILTTSGDNLKLKVIEVFESIFNLYIDPIDENIEDFKILDSEKNIIAVVEVKGTKKGVKRQHINQVDSHRERNNLPSETLGILVINNEMSLEGYEKRAETSIPEEHIKHACNLKVLIIRTIDLIYLIKHFEVSSDNNQIIDLVLNSTGGWLKVDSNGYAIEI